MRKGMKVVLLSAATLLATTTMNAGLVYRSMFPVEEIALDMTEQLDYRLRLSTHQFDEVFYYYCNWIDDALDRMEYNGLFPISDRQFDIMLDRGFSYFYDDDYVFVARSRFFRSILSSTQYRLWRNIELGRRTDVNVYVNIYPFGFPRFTRPRFDFVFHRVPTAPYHRHDGYRPAPRPDMGHNMAPGPNQPRPNGNMPAGNHGNGGNGGNGGDRNDRGNGTVSGNHGNAVSGGETNRGNNPTTRPSTGSGNEVRRDRNGSTTSTETRRTDNSMSNSTRPTSTRIDYGGTSTSSSSRGTSTRTESRRTSTSSTVTSGNNRQSSARTGESSRSSSSSSSTRQSSQPSRSSSTPSRSSSSSSSRSSSNGNDSSSSSHQRR